MKKISKRRKKFLKRYEQCSRNYKFIFLRRPSIKKVRKNTMYKAPLDRRVKATVNCPENFSIISNGKEVVAMLNLIKMHIKERKYVTVDFKSVNHIDIDALIALLATVRDLHHKFGDVIQKKVTFSAPKDKKIKEFVENSGFFKFAVSRELILKSENNHFEIHMSDNFTKEDIYQICVFACGTTEKTKRLYPIIVELLNNVRTHAYKKSDLNMPHGYIFCQKMPNYSTFVLMDTGRTIPKTVYKRLDKDTLKLFSRIGFDSELIASALRGENRSETGLPNRNKGLKQIIDSNSPLLDIKIISRKGKYSKNNDLQGDYTFNGTLFNFNV